MQITAIKDLCKKEDIKFVKTHSSTYIQDLINTHPCDVTRGWKTGRMIDSKYLSNRLFKTLHKRTVS